jgi:hypothetical protein
MAATRARRAASSAVAREEFELFMTTASALRLGGRGNFL